jgi:uncharacterized protein (TIGR02996 family)
MTAQFAECLRFRGEELRLYAEPLEPYFAAGHPKPEFNGLCSACWRGYVGTWAVRDDVLYVVDIDSPLGGPADSRMREVFPDHPDGRPADWCTDLLRVALGGLVDYVHMGYASTFERDLMLAVDRGRLVYLEEIDNRTRTVTRRELTAKAADVFPADDAAFLRGVADAGWADAPKLVYADWLDDRSDPRGELVRVEIERSKLPPGKRRRALAGRRAELYPRAGWLWAKAMGFGLPRSHWDGLELMPQLWERFERRDGRMWDRELRDPPEG